MAYFKICVRNKRADGIYPIYIRVTHNRKIGYIKTDKTCKAKFVKGGNIVDPFIIKDVYISINRYIDMLNMVNIEDWSIKKVISYLKEPLSSITSFSEFCENYIESELEQGHTGANNYRIALNALKKFLNTDEILFSDLTEQVISSWIYSMYDSKNKKSSYPKYIKTMFYKAKEKYNNYDMGIIIIKGDPFKNVKIPIPELPRKKALDLDSIRKFFLIELPSIDPYKKCFTNAQMARDVCMMVFCLAGINTVDLFSLQKDNYKKGKLCYNRSKTKGRRFDQAYIEISVPDVIKPLFKKYEGKKNLLCFAEHYDDSLAFNHAVNNKIKQIAEHCNLGYISTYSFRHSWATIASNDLNIDIATVGFCLNHVPLNKVTWGYITPDFTKIDRINEKVLDLVFDKKNR